MLYKPTDNGSLYANYATSQQPPGGATLELSTSANNANNPIFDPQKAKTAEVGSKWELAGGDLLNLILLGVAPAGINAVHFQESAATVASYWALGAVGAAFLAGVGMLLRARRP